MPLLEVHHYLTSSRKDVFEDWVASLGDKRAAAQIAVRIDRLARGNFGDCKPVGQGVSELRIACGPGYRVYYAMTGRTCVLLLCGGDKHRQSADIKRAVGYFNDYVSRRTRP